MKKATKGGYIHGLYVSAKTKNEFKQNKSSYREEGIKSAYSLQKQKNIATQALKLERAARREEIRLAYEKDAERLQAIGYDVKFFLNQFQRIEDYNQKIRINIQKGNILANTPLLSFPISLDTGKISLKRLQKELKKLDNSINKIKNKQYKIFFNNVKEVYGEEIYKLSVDALKDVPINKIYDTFNDDIYLSYIVNYDIDEFNSNDRLYHWENVSKAQNHFLDLIEEVRRGI